MFLVVSPTIFPPEFKESVFDSPRIENFLERLCVEVILLHRARSAVRQAAESSSWSVVMIRGNLR